MIVSRCGLVCTDCSCREATGCTGCMQMDRPFWGDCAVKSCCENRGLAHCGQCRKFPCLLLKQFAYDREQGDEGRRIARCQTWKSRIIN